MPVTAAPDDEEGDDDEFDSETPMSAPPEADVVAARALMVGALLRRAEMESAPNTVRSTALAGWVEDNGLFGNLGAEGAELFDAAPGAWTDEDVDAVSWTTEELQTLLWALNQAEFPALETRAEAEPLLAKLPIEKPIDAYLTGAKLRDLHELEVKRALYEALLEAVRSEAYARSIAEDPSGLEGDDELEELLASIESDGFDRAAAAAKGKAVEAQEGLRFWSRSLLNDLFETGSPHLDSKIDSAALVGMEEHRLALLLGLAHARAEALAWLTEGDEYATEDDEAFEDEA